MEENNYTVYEHITPDGMYYFGVTTNTKSRWKPHLYNETSLKPYIDKFGWDNIQHKILFTNQTKDNAFFIEDFLIKTAEDDCVCINKNKSGLITEDWNAYMRKYRDINREKCKSYMRNYMRKYNRRKKCIKQLNEIGYIPLF